MEVSRVHAPGCVRTLLGREEKNKTGGLRRSLVQVKYDPELLRVDIQKGLTFNDTPLGGFQM